MSDGVPVPIQFALDDRPVDSETAVIRFSPYVLSVRTVLPDTPLCAELHSVFTGHRAIATEATHLLLGPVGHRPVRAARDHVREAADPVERPESCVLEHVFQVVEMLSLTGRVVSVTELDDAALTRLTRLHM